MKQTHLLHRALRMNALFSGISSLFLLIAAPWIAAQLGLNGSWPVYVVGVGLALFSLQLTHIVRSQVYRTAEIAAIIGGDILWVVASVVLVALFYSGMTTTGLLLVDGVALAVLFFAIQQLRGLRALRRDNPVPAAS